MKQGLILLGVCLVLSGCQTPGPAVSKSSQGNLCLRVDNAAGAPLEQAAIFIDDHFIGNSDNNRPVLFLRKGPRKVRVSCPGFKTCEQTIIILGEPNRQILIVVLEPQ